MGCVVWSVTLGFISGSVLLPFIIFVFLFGVRVLFFLLVSGVGVCVLREPEPVHAQGFFSVSRRGDVNQVVVYDYYDPDYYYLKLAHRPLDYEREVARLAGNMQYFLDQEEVVVNGVRVRPVVKSVSIDHRGFAEIAYVTFIIYFKARLRKGLNTYENRYEAGVAEYDYEVYWIFPPRTRVVEVDLSADYEVLGDDNILLFWVRRGDRINGYERIVFELY